MAYLVVFKYISGPYSGDLVAVPLGWLNFNLLLAQY